MRPTSLTIALATCSIALGALGAARAHAGGGGSGSGAAPGADAVIVVGKVPPQQRAVVASAVRSAARSGGWNPLDDAFTAAESDAIGACLKAPQLWRCVSAQVIVKGVTRVIIVRLEASPAHAAAITVTEQIAIEGSEVTSADQRYCAACADDALTRVAFDLTTGLLKEAASGSARTTVTITSSPPGAWITIDGANVGLTDHTYSTFPGHHTIILQRDGFATEVRTIDVAENKHTDVAVVLRARGAGGAVVSPPLDDAHPHVVPAIVGGVGIAAVVGGLLLQDAASPPSSGRQPATLVSPPGIGLAIGGGVAIGVGIYLWVRASHAPAPAALPAVNVTHDSATIGWTGRF